MSDTDAAAADTATAIAPGEPARLPADHPLVRSLEMWKAEAKGLRESGKAGVEAAKRLAEIEEASKTESQKLADKVAASDKEAASTRGELLRLRVAMRKGLTEAQAKRLIGSTEEEIEADADELLKSFGQTTEPGAGKPTRPKERLRSGTGPSDEPNPNQVINDRIRQAAGRTS